MMTSPLVYPVLLIAVGLLAVAVPERSAPAQDRNALPPLDEKVILADDAYLAALGKLEDYFRTTHSFTAPFTQQSPDGSVSTGTLSVERPGRMRVDYDKDVPLLVVSDGKILNLVDQEIGQVTKWPVSDTPLRLLLSDRLDLSGLDTVIDPAADGVEKALTISASDPAQPDFGRLIAYFEDRQGVGLELLGWSVIDTFGGQTTVSLGEAKRNVPLSERLWTFEDPRGAKRRLRR